MKHLLLILSFCLVYFSSTAQSLNWAKKMGGTQEDYAAALAVDAQSNVLVAGYFNGTADFDPGTGVVNLVSAGAEDIYVSRLTSAGEFSWAFAIGGAGADKACGLATDAQGNVYVAGFFSGVVDFDPGAGTSNLTSNGAESDIFILKLNSAGVFQWVKQIGNATSESYCNLRSDGQGNLLLTSVFSGTIDLDPGVGELNATASGEGTLIVKISSGGNLVWGKSISSGRVFSFVTDASGNLTLTGTGFSGSDLDPGTGNASVPSGFTGDVAVVFRLNSSGAFVWLKAFGCKTFPGGATATSIGTDPSGNVLVTGFFMGKVDLNPSTGAADTAFARTSGGQPNQFDIFLVKLNSAGSFQWGCGMGSTGTDYGSSVVADASGNVWTQGTIGGSTDFDPGSGTYTINASGYVAKYSAGGQFMMADKMAVGQTMSYGMPWTPKLERDASGSVFSVGNFSGTLDAEPGNNTTSLTSTGSFDVYVSKLTPCGAPGITAQPVSQNVCPGAPASFTVTPSGTGPFTYQWKKGTTILAGSSNTYSIAATSAANAGSYTVTVFSACGSTISAAAPLTLKTATSISTPPAATSACAGANASLTVTAAGTGPFTYVWKKGTTVVGGNSATLSLTNLSQANAGSYTVTATGACGSATSSPVILTVNTVSPIATTSGQSLTVSIPGTYQWLNCNTGNSPIAGQTGNSFTPTVSGNYAVRVTSAAGCVGTSPCVNFTVTGVEDEVTRSEVGFFPNPVANHLNLRSDEPAFYALYDVNGKKVLHGSWNGGLHTLDVSRLSHGLYSLRINLKTFRLVK